MYTGTPPPPEIWPMNDFEKNLPHHEMMWVEGGEFTMGSDDKEANGEENYLRKVKVSSFCMAIFPVTEVLYETILAKYLNIHLNAAAENGGHKREVNILSSHVLLGFGNSYPVGGVSWNEAKLFVQKLNEKTGRTHAQWQYDLPTEAQWEYAALGGEGMPVMKYAGSDKLKEVGWFEANSHGKTKPVGLKQPNPLGLYDMSGNVWEWCEDDWHYSYEGGPLDGSAWLDAPERNSRRVCRGGSCHTSPMFCRRTFRSRWYTDFDSTDVGLRLILVPK